MKSLGRQLEPKQKIFKNEFQFQFVTFGVMKDLENHTFHIQT